MSLSNDILDAIDGAEETRGRDSRYQEWADRAKTMEDAMQHLIDICDRGSPLEIVALISAAAERQRIVLRELKGFT